MRRLLPLVVLFTACTRMPTPNPGPGFQVCDVPAVGCPCLEDAHCGSTPHYLCDFQRSECVPGCETDDHCNTRPDGIALEQCAGMGCWCDEATCVAKQCASDAECPGQVCRDGACVPTPDDAQLTRCEVQPDFATVATGDVVHFEVLAWNAAGAPLISGTGPQWETSAPLTLTSHGNAADLTVGAGPSGSRVITARFGTVTCTANVARLPDAQAGELVVAVLDEVTQRPVPGARVMSSDATGVVVPQAGADTVLTDADGLAVLRTQVAAMNVSVFHPDFAYQTVVSVPAAPRLLRLQVRRTPKAALGGVVGTFQSLPNTPNIHLARTGLGAVGAWSELDFTDEHEPVAPAAIRIGSAISQDTLMPQGTVAGFGQQVFKGTFVNYGAPSSCDGVADGACGTQASWAITNDLKLADFPVDLFYGAPVQRLMPTLIRIGARRSYSSTVQRDVRFGFQPTPGVLDGMPDFTATQHFTRVTVPFGQVRMGYTFGVKLPALPGGLNGFAEEVLATGVVQVPGRGLIPLGLGTAANLLPNDARVDVFNDTGLLAMRMAPAHHGLEGRAYGVLLNARSTAFRQRAWEGAWTSSRLTWVGESLPFDPNHTTPLDLSSEPWLATPRGRFDFRSRTFTRGAFDTTGASLLRVRFEDRTGGRWDVLLAPSAVGFTLPVPPADLPDRVYLDGQRQGATRALWSQQLEAHHGLDFAGVVSGRSVDTLRAWSHLDVRALSVVPRFGANAVLPAGSRLEFAVEGVLLGGEGVLRLSFPSSPCNSTDVNGFTQDDGLVAVTTPANCTGSLRVRAEVLDVSRQPLSPPVFVEQPLRLE